MSRSELHDWECTIEELSGGNADKMLDIAQDIYNTAFVRGKNSVSWEQPRWIPIDERLPEPQKEFGDKNFSDWVLVSIKINPYQSIVCSAYYCFSEKKWYMKRIGCGKILAWQPLPKSYKPESEGE